MAEDNDLERTEPPSQRRLEQAREEGQVARSRELATFLLLFAAGGGFYQMGSGLVQQMGQSLKAALSISHADALDSHGLTHRLHTLSQEALMTALPLLSLLIAASLVAPLLLGGWLFSVKAV